MIKTDKYKKGVVALSEKATEYFPNLGGYRSHYINKYARFVILFSNGHMEIGINLARDHELSSPEVDFEKLREVTVIFGKESKSEKRLRMDVVWSRLFEVRKPDYAR